MTELSVIALVGILLSGGLSFFFALAETALFSLSKWQVRKLAEQPGGRGELVHRLLAEPQDLLGALALGNTVSTMALIALALGMAFRGDWLPGWTLAMTGVLVLFGCEVLPKTLAVRRPEMWALRVAGPLVLWRAFVAPVGRVAQRVNAAIIRAVVPRSVKPQSAPNDADYKELLELAYQHGALAATEKDIILEIVRLDQRTVKEVMRPRARMAMLSDTLTVEEMRAAARRLKHRRLPLYDEDSDTIVGVLNTRELLLNPEADLEDVLEFPSFVPETMNLLQLLLALQRQQRGLAIALDEFGGVAGVVTVENILEELVGDIRSEGETVEFQLERLGEGCWRVNGTMKLDEFRDEYPALVEPAGVETMGGLLMHVLGVVPTAGESVIYGSLRLTAKRVDERRVRELLVEVVRRKGGAA